MAGIYVITDQVIGFVGNAISSQPGRDTEDKVNNMFMVAARVGPSAINSVGNARTKPRKLRQSELAVNPIPVRRAKVSVAIAPSVFDIAPHIGDVIPAAAGNGIHLLGCAMNPLPKTLCS